MREVLLDIDEGADIVMVKAALAYLDIIAMIAATSGCRSPLTRSARVRDGRGSGAQAGWTGTGSS